MSLTPSTMLPLGTALPPFQLADLDGRVHDSTALPPQPLLVLFLCAHCPFVKHIEPELTRLEHDYNDRVVILAIASNSVRTHPGDGPEGLNDQRRRHGWRFPYLLDSDQNAARAFHAACTPDLYLYGADHRLAYRGQLDASRPGTGQAADGSALREALDAVLSGQAPDPDQRPAIGCNIKWHPGQAPPGTEG